MRLESVVMKALSLGVAAALVCAPIAGADDPDDCNQLPPDQVQQCQQRKDAKIAQDILNNANRGNGQQPQEPAKQPDRNKPLTGGTLMYVNGVLMCLQSGATFRNNERLESYIPPNGDPRC